MAHTVSPEDRSFQSTEEENLPQDSPDTTLRLGDVTALQTAVLSDRTHTTTISRAGERTLLSVTSSNNNTSSAFTEDSSSQQPSSTWGSPPTPAETEDYTQSAPSTRTEGREQHTHGAFSETGSPVGVRGTPTLTGQPNATTHQRSSTAQETPDSTPPLWVTELSTNQSEASVSATPSFTSLLGGPGNVSGTDDGSRLSVGTSTEATTGAHSSSTPNQEGTEGLSSETSEGSLRRGLTAAPSTVSSSTSEMNDSSTDGPVFVTEVFLTTEPVNVTDR